MLGTKTWESPEIYRLHGHPDFDDAGRPLRNTVANGAVSFEHAGRDLR